MTDDRCLLTVHCEQWDTFLFISPVSSKWGLGNKIKNTIFQSPVPKLFFEKLQIA